MLALPCTTLQYFAILRLQKKKKGNLIASLTNISLLPFYAYDDDDDEYDDYDDDKDDE